MTPKADPRRAASPFALLAPAALAALLAPAALAEPPEAEADPFRRAELAQDFSQPVALVADRVSFDNAAGLLVAEGAVEIYQGDRTLTADRITYNTETGRIEAAGEITLRTPEGVTLVADFAELDDRLQDAVIESARMQLPGDARFAAARAQRVEGRYNVLDRAVFSPCRVCAADPVPLWRIRARRIVHDEQDKVVHYEDATFDIMGVSVAWLPYFRHPDPSVDRASGVLFPRYLRGSAFGHAVKLPVHLVLDDASDLTLTPFVTEKDGAILEGEYRRTFARGALTFGGSVGHNDYDGDARLRGHVDAAGLWEIGDGIGLTGWETGFDLELASDDAYLRRYDLSEIDRLTSELFVRQSDDRGWMELSAVRFQSLREDEPIGAIPLVLPSFEGGRRLFDDLGGGTLDLSVAGYGLKRSGGQDAAHLGARLDWERGMTLDWGLELRAYGQLQGDAWSVADPDPGVDQTAGRVHPQAAVEARFPVFRRDVTGPLAGAMGGGATHVLTPIVQLVAAPNRSAIGAGSPNEDSQIVEFDETSLFALGRHAGWDGVEEGFRANIGLRYALTGDDGTRFDAAVGQVQRIAASDAFGAGSGLDGSESDYVGGWSVEAPGIGRLAHRLRLDQSFEIERNEVYAELDWDAVTLTGSYVYLSPTAASGEERHEAAMEGWYQFTDQWAVGAQFRRDLATERWVRTEGAIRFSNECADLEFHAGRRFTSTADAPASTYAGLRIRLRALGGDVGGRGAKPSDACTPEGLEARVQER
ncbi:LPS-assembly protein LptD [Rhodovulum sp. DZ06]|uniref:LPS-assembly protein LptD n=1 Tax=Rhodovulum sp. DZ06 TaxID=3425126 RepID=UPI003D35844E